MKKSITIRDLASATGVSPATVSLVFQNDTRISHATTHKVHQQARAMGYSHTPRPRKTTPVKTRRIKVYIGVSHIKHIAPIYSEVIAGIEEGCRKSDVVMMLEYVDRQASQIDLKDDPASSLIMGMMNHDLEKQIVTQTSLPIVKVMGTPQAHWHNDLVSYQNNHIGLLVAEKFHAQGHQRVCILGPDRPKKTIFQQRMLSTQTALKSMNIQSQIYQLSDTPDLKPVQLDQFIQQWQQDQVTGIFTTADEYAALLYQKLWEHGIKPEQDITVISCNNETPILTTLTPQPQSVDIHPRAIGRTAVRQLLWRIKHPCEPIQNLLIMPTLHAIKPKTKPNII